MPGTFLGALPNWEVTTVFILILQTGKTEAQRGWVDAHAGKPELGFKPKQSGSKFRA